jgi:hypothetical protein
MLKLLENLASSNGEFESFETQRTSEPGRSSEAQRGALRSAADSELTQSKPGGCHGDASLLCDDCKCDQWVQIDLTGGFQ